MANEPSKTARERAHALVSDAKRLFSKRRPRITAAVLEGIISATSLLLAGDVEATFENDPDPERHESGVEAADKWAKDMREWMRARRTGKGK